MEYTKRDAKAAFRRAHRSARMANHYDPEKVYWAALRSLWRSGISGRAAAFLVQETLGLTLPGGWWLPVGASANGRKIVA